MSYKSLLFCPDESSAQALMQILSELEFAVEAAGEPFAAVKKLSEERFDALIVDCHQDQDAALIFKTARDSAQNHSSLSVAVVEGQTGIAKAFRIGANLVLTKPINVEQAKGTLRVARGLLRKPEAQTATPVAAGKPGAAAARTSAPPDARTPSVSQTSATVLSRDLAVTAFPGATIQRPSLPAAQASTSFSALEREADPAPTTGAAELAVLESLSDHSGKPAGVTPSAPRLEAEPVAAGASGQAAAVAPALEKIPVLGVNTASAAPMVSNEPIVAEKRYEDPLGPSIVEAPRFSILETQASPNSGGAAKFFKLAFVFAALFVITYFGWQRLQPMQYLQQLRASRSESAADPVQHTQAPAQPSSVAPASTPASAPSSVSLSPASVSPSTQDAKSDQSAPPVSEDKATASAERTPKSNNIETIEIKEMPMPGDPKPSAPKVQALVVKPDSGNMNPAKVVPTAPPVQVSNLNSSSAALPDLTKVDTALPKLAPGAVRVSQGVSQGLILKRVPPAYPPMALRLGKEGSVELLATISKQGTIGEVQVLSGDAMLSKAAADAVRQWKYRPYLLNGEPVAIQTQITIVFKAPR